MRRAEAREFAVDVANAVKRNVQFSRANEQERDRTTVNIRTGRLLRLVPAQELRHRVNGRGA